MSLTAVQVKANANYQCSECGDTELVQSHHEIPGDDDSQVCLCAGHHADRHPDLPRALFFSVMQQPWWQNKSASSLAREHKVHSRTVIRYARRLGISRGYLDEEQEERLCAALALVPRWRSKEEKEADAVSRYLARRQAAQARLGPIDSYYTVSPAAEVLGVTRQTISRWLRDGTLNGREVGRKVVIQRTAVIELQMQQANVAGLELVNLIEKLSPILRNDAARKLADAFAKVGEQSVQSATGFRRVKVKG